MPKEIKDLKVFMNYFTTESALSDKIEKEEKHRPKNVYKKRLTVKRNKTITKFKLRTKKYLLTYKTKDTKVIKKILKHLPSSIEKIDIKSRSDARKAAQKK